MKLSDLSLAPSEELQRMAELVGSLNRSIAPAESVLEILEWIDRDRSTIEEAMAVSRAGIEVHRLIHDLDPVDRLREVQKEYEVMVGPPALDSINEVLDLLSRWPSRELLQAVDALGSPVSRQSWIERELHALARSTGLELPLDLPRILGEQLATLGVDLTAEETLDERETVLSVMGFIVDRVASQLGDWGRHRDVILYLIPLLVSLLIAHSQNRSASRAQTEMLAEMRKQHLALKDEIERIERRPTSLKWVALGSVSRDAHLRVLPSRGSESLGVLSAGEQVVIVGREGDWLQVTADFPNGVLKAGWIYSRRVASIP